jgi:hypothetical protein
MQLEEEEEIKQKVDVLRTAATAKKQVQKNRERKAEAEAIMSRQRLGGSWLYKAGL